MELEKILKSWESSVDNSLEKSKKDYSKLVPVQKQVVKQGKTYMTTVYVSPKEAEEMDKMNPAAKDAIKKIGWQADHETLHYAENPKVEGNMLIYSYHGPQGKAKQYADYFVEDLKDLGYKATANVFGDVAVHLPNSAGASKPAPKKVEPKKEAPKKTEPQKEEPVNEVHFDDLSLGMIATIGNKKGKITNFFFDDNANAMVTVKYDDGTSQTVDFFEVIKVEPKPKEEPKSEPKPKGKIPAVDINKQLRPIRKALGTDNYKEYLKANGITWEENKENAGADTMRASAAAKKFLEEGGELNKELLDHMTKGGTVEQFKKQKEDAKAEEDAKKKADDEAKKKAEEEAKKKAEPKKKIPTAEISSHLRTIRKSLGTAKYKEFLKSNGVSWEENTENEGADTMRASSAAKKFLESGGQLDDGLYKHMLAGGKAEDYTKTANDEPKNEEPKKDEPKVNKEPEGLGDYFSPVSNLLSSEFKKFDKSINAIEDPKLKSELKPFFDGLKEVVTKEDFNKLLKSKGTPNTKPYFKDLTWDMKEIFDNKEETFGVKGYSYGFPAGKIVSKITKGINSKTEKLEGVHLQKVQSYTGSGYSDLNKYLRGLAEGTVKKKVGAHEETAKVLDEVLNNNEMQKNVILFRGVKPPSGHDLEKLVEGIKNGNPKDFIGTEISDPGFASTTVKMGKSFSGGLQLHIKAPKGTKGMYVKEYSYHSHEEEWLLPRDTTLVIEDVKVDGYKVHALVSIKEN